eukprot:3084932-Amphidinium_carterae.1
MLSFTTIVTTCSSAAVSVASLNHRGPRFQYCSSLGKLQLQNLSRESARVKSQVVNSKAGARMEEPRFVRGVGCATIARPVR